MMKEEYVTTFTDLQLSEPLLRALAAEGYESPTPIQAKAIPSLLEGKDLLGIAQTGTGKTAAFALPILQKLAAHPERAAKGTCRALILSPTRELAAQIGESFRVYGKFLKVTRAVVFGGVSLSKQIDIVRGGVDVVVATPGRLVDLIERRALTLSKVEIFVLDEVDQMLDLGFIHAIRKITGMLPSQRQNLFFSATMPKEISGLANALLTDPVRVEVAPVATTAERVNQSVIHVDPANKAKLLVDLLKDNNMTRTLVFTRTKHGADKVMKNLSTAGYTAAAIHGNKSQNNPSGRWPASRRARSSSSWQPTSPRAASTSMACPTSSTTTCRMCRKATCTASAARRAPEPMARPSPSARRKTVACCATSRRPSAPRCR
jgi:ATP-dependent RNA helicase RhlE